MRTLEEIKIRRLFCDSGMRSPLQARSLKPGEFPERWNLTHRDVLIPIRRPYLEVGADIMTANIFDVNGSKSKEDLEPIVTAAVGSVRTAAKEAGHGHVVLGLGPTGRLLKSLGDLESENAVKPHKGVVSIGVRAGADLVLIETVSDSYELEAAVLVAREAGFRPNTGERLPVFATVIFDERGKLLTGGNVESTMALLEGLRVDALGINCGLGPVQMKRILEEILRVSSLPMLVDPNTGPPRNGNGETVYNIDTEGSVLVMEEIAAMSAMVVGECCGATLEHMCLMMRRCKDMPVVWLEKKHRTVVSSHAKAVTVGGKTTIIGECIGPTDKSRFEQTLWGHNLEYILKEGVSQQDSGVNVLDVNVGLSEIHEPFMMEEAIREPQAIINLPLQVDTSDMEAMERAMRIYNRKPLIDFVNGKGESMTHVPSLMAEYGGVAVGLCLDESGISDAAEGRLTVGRKIIDRIAEYGTGSEDVILDGLYVTVSSGSKGALTILETLRRIQDELGVGTVLEVSNISLELSQREIINAALFTMAMERGLGAAIISPSFGAMMRAYYSFNALMDLDPQCGQYVSICSGQSAGPDWTIGRGGSQDGTKADHQSRSGEAGAGQGPALLAVIERSLREIAHNTISALLKEREPLNIINNEMIPALDRVGKRFEEGTMFLPQLLTSTKVAKAAFEIIKVVTDGSGQAQEKERTTILATVKGDIHDIGKNTAKILLGDYSCEVIDLGGDIPPGAIAEETVERQVVLVGLGALMITTVPSMEETTRQLRIAPATVKMIVEDAMLTEDYARIIGTDTYCRDAMVPVNYAEQTPGA